jgi:prepilin-type N-terminal cleavage/methylation domain-containing protein
VTIRSRYPDVSQTRDCGLRIADCGLAPRVSLNPKSEIRNPKLKRAFTLLELMAAMVLMVVVASCLYTALYTGFRAYRSAQSAVEPTLLAVNAIDLLKEDMSGVLPPGSALAGAFTGTDARGAKGVDADSVEFYTTHIYVYADDEQLAGGLGKIQLLLEEDPNSEDGSYLLVRRLTTNLLAPKEAEAEEQVLCRRVVSMNLRYFDGSGWAEEWDSTADANSLPLAVEVDIQIAHNGKKGMHEPQKRRLVQSFALPCQTPAQEESDSAI